MPELAGRDGFTNAELCEMWPRTPNVTCGHCGERKTCTWFLEPVQLLCDGCLRMPSLVSTRGGQS